MRRKQHYIPRVEAGAPDPIPDGKQGQHGIDIILRQVAVAVQDEDQLIQDLLDTVDGICLSSKEDLGAPRRDLRIRKGGLNPSKEDVVEAEKKQGFYTLNGNTFLCQRRYAYPLLHEGTIRPLGRIIS